MDVKELALLAIKGLQNGRFEICPGLSNVLRFMSLVAPNLAVKAVSG